MFVCLFTSKFSALRSGLRQLNLSREKTQFQCLTRRCELAALGSLVLRLRGLERPFVTVYTWVRESTPPPTSEGIKDPLKIKPVQYN